SRSPKPYRLRASSRTIRLVCSCSCSPSVAIWATSAGTNTENPTPPVSMTTRAGAVCSSVPRNEEIMSPAYRRRRRSTPIDRRPPAAYCTGKDQTSRKSAYVIDDPSANARPRRLTLQDPRRRHDLDCLLVVRDRPLDPAEETLHDVLRHGIVARVDRGQTRDEELALEVVVETDHLHLVGDPQLEVGECPQHPQRGRLGQGEDAVEGHTLSVQAHDLLVSVDGRERRRDADEPLVDGDSGELMRTTVSARPQRRHAVAEPSPASPDERDAGRSGFDET